MGRFSHVFLVPVRPDGLYTLMASLSVPNCKWSCLIHLDLVYAYDPNICNSWSIRRISTRSCRENLRWVPPASWPSSFTGYVEVKICRIHYTVRKPCLQPPMVIAPEGLRVFHGAGTFLWIHSTVIASCFHICTDYSYFARISLCALEIVFSSVVLLRSRSSCDCLLVNFLVFLDPLFFLIVWFDFCFWSYFRFISLSW